MTKDDKASVSRREQLRTVRFYDPAKIQVENAFQMSDRSSYGKMPEGNFVRLDKDRRSVKERKRARREARGGQ